MGKRERIIELATRIGSMRQELTRLEQELDGLLPETAAGASVVAPAARSSHSNGSVSGSLSSRVVEFLNANPGRAYDAAEIAKGLGANDVVYLRGVLSRHFKAHRIQRLKRGKYRARKESPEATTNA